MRERDVRMVTSAKSQGYIYCIIWIFLGFCACSSDKYQQELYKIEHFWDKYDFTDTLSDDKQDVTEQMLMDYLKLLPRITDKKACDVLKRFTAKFMANQEISSCFLYQMELLLFEPNSPVRNDEYYIAVLEEALASENLKGMMRVRPMYQLRMLQKNRQGEKAADFTFTFTDGQTGKLWNIPAKYILLMFYDPSCEHCQELIRELAASHLVNQLLSISEQGIPYLSLVTICMENSGDAWERCCIALPGAWLNGYDSENELIEKELYFLRSLPSLYLLGEDKMVLLKDAPIGKILDYLN